MLATDKKKKRKNPTFLRQDPVHWDADADVQSGLPAVCQLKIVNDAAKRGLQLITRYMKGNKLAMEEEERQRLVVSEDRKKKPYVKENL